MSYARQHLEEAKKIIDLIDHESVERVAEILGSVRERGGRLFFLGGVPATGERVALAASSSGGGGFDFSGGFFVLREQGGSWRVVSQDRYWIA